jgi:hypothetical protein
MNALLLAASLVAPAPHAGGLPSFPDLDTLAREYRNYPDHAVYAYGAGVIVENIPIPRPLKLINGCGIRTGPHSLTFGYTPREEMMSWEGKTVRAVVKVGSFTVRGDPPRLGAECRVVMVK